jgi:hypothetical protein
MEDLSRQHRWQEEDLKTKASVVDLHDLEADYTGTKAIVLSTAVDVAQLQRSVSAQTPTTSVPGDLQEKMENGQRILTSAIDTISRSTSGHTLRIERLEDDFKGRPSVEDVNSAIK